jgi:spore coat-associated protein N
MTIKKKLGMGILTGVMGLSLVGGGTWAAFTDEEQAMNKFAAGTLNLQLEKSNGNELGATALDLSNMKPGDSKDYDIYFDNIGSLAIKEVWVSGERASSGWIDAPAPYGETPSEFKNFEGEFLEQFTIKISDGANLQTPFLSKNLKSFLEGNTSKDAIANASEPGNGLPVANDRDFIRVTITFKDDGNQNKFMGDSAQFKLKFLATQYDGIQIDHEGNATDGDKLIKDAVNSSGVIEYNKNQPYTNVADIDDEGHAN